MDHDPLASPTRRQLLGAALGGATAVALGAAATARDGEAHAHAGDHHAPARTPRTRMPVVYLPHGGGPWPFVEMNFFDPREKASLLAYLRSVHTAPPARPTALLVVTAHWEAPVATVSSAAHPPLLFDYYNFPPESYRITWPAPGHPALAARVRALLDASGISSAEDSQRGFDHGTFVPLKVAYPEADIPVVQLSLVAGLDPVQHLALGRALAPLRDEGVFIVGSGMSFHNMRGFGGAGRAVSESFDAWLCESALLAEHPRAERLARWTEAPGARQCHPREEHLLPLMVIAGAAGSDAGRVAYNDHFGGVKVSAFQFG